MKWEVVKMKKYKVYDLYDGKKCIGYADTIKEVKKLAKEYYEETDGKCQIYYAELNRETNKYKLFSSKKIFSNKNVWGRKIPF